MAIIKELDIEGYRSIQKLVLNLGQLNIITGANGCYHNFRTNENSTMRIPQIGVRTVVLSNNGHDLAAALGTIIEIGAKDKLDELIELAFPGSKLAIIDPYVKSRFEIHFQMKGLLRPLDASEN